MQSNEEIELTQSPLRIGVSTRALFNLEQEHEVFRTQGVQAYAEFQLKRERQILEHGPGFSVVKNLLMLNKGRKSPLVEVILLSRNSPDLSLRAFNSIEHYNLEIRTGSFTSGRTLGPYVPAWKVDLFLSNEETDVKDAIAAGAAAAKLGLTPDVASCPDSDEVRIAFDGDSVVFSQESDEIFKEKGLDEFLRHERDNARNPMAGGPFGNFLKKLSKLRKIYLNESGVSRVRIAIVTSRNVPEHARVIHTLREWGTPADEAHFVGKNDKGPILSAFRAQIFFDDQEKHVLSAAPYVTSGLVPGPNSPEFPVIPAV